MRRLFVSVLFASCVEPPVVNDPPRGQVVAPTATASATDTRAEVPSAAVAASAAPQASSLPSASSTAQPAAPKAQTGLEVDVSAVIEGRYKVDSFVESPDCKKKSSRRDVPFLRITKEKTSFGALVTVTQCKDAKTCEDLLTSAVDQELPVYSAFSEGGACQLTESRLNFDTTAKKLKLERRERVLSVKGGCPQTGEVGVTFRANEASASCERYLSVEAHLLP